MDRLLATAMKGSFEQGGETPLIANNPPRLIWYSEQPPAAGGVPEQIPIQEFMRRYVAHGGEAFEYTETVWSKPKFIRAINAADPEKRYKEFRPAFENFLRNPQQLIDKLIVSFISPEVGFGVFAREKIPANQIIIFYSGILGYAFAAAFKGAYGLCPHESFAEHSIDAGLKGGIARFFQHLPKSLFRRYYDEYLFFKKNPTAKVKFALAGFMEDLIRKPLISPERFAKIYSEVCPNIPFLDYKPDGDGDIASENIDRDLYIMDGVPLNFIFSTRDIEPFEQLGFTYGSDYWEGMGKDPVLFNKQGLPIPNSHMCMFCKKVALDLQKCGRCQQVHYCSRECQVKHWSVHKVTCGQKK